MKNGSRPLTYALLLWAILATAALLYVTVRRHRYEWRDRLDGCVIRIDQDTGDTDIACQPGWDWRRFQP